MWLVRHGETAWSQAGRHTGRTDVPLVAAGRAQARAAAHLLRGADPVLVLSSPRRRALETARLAGFEPIVDDDLAEWDYGRYEGMTTAEIRARHPGWTLWRDGAPGGETPMAVSERAGRVVERVRSAGGDVICFSHGHLLRALAARWVGLDPAGGRLLALGAGTVSRLGWEREVPVVQGWNWSPVPGPPCQPE